MSKKILFCPLHPTSLQKMLKVAKLIEQNNGQCVFLNSTEYTHANDHLISNHGFQQIKLQTAFSLSVFERIVMTVRASLQLFFSQEDLPLLNDKRFSLFKLLLALKKKFYYLRLQQNFILEYKKRIRIVNNLFEQNHFDSIVVAGDRHLSYENVILFESEKRNIPCFIPPISISNNPQVYAKYRLLKSSNFDVTDNLRFQQRWPKQCCETNSRVTTFYPFWFIKPLDELGILPPKPWNMGSGLAEKYMVGGDADAERYVANGSDVKKIVVTGDPEFDELYEIFVNEKELTAKLTSRYKLFANRKLIIIALPQLYEHGMLPYDEHMDVIHTICNAAKRSKANILISLHPKMELNNYKFLEEQYGLSILDERLSQVLPAADVLINTQGSSTWIWSVLCEIPVVVCDWFGHDAEISDAKYGVRIIKQKSEMGKEVSDLINDEHYYADMQLLCKKAKNQVGRFDGQCGKRLVEHILG